MFCPKCGSENPDNAAFCGDCGTSMPTNEPVTTTQPRAQPRSTSGSGGTTKPAVAQELKIGIIIASIIIPLVGIIMGAIFMFDSNASPEKKSVGRTWLFVGIGAFVVWFIIILSGG